MQAILIFSISHRIPPISILYIFIGGIQPVRHMGKGGSRWREQQKMRGVWSKKGCPAHKFFCVDFFCNSIFIPSVWRSSDKIKLSRKNSTSKKEPASVSKIPIPIKLICTKNISYTALSMRVVYTEMCDHKLSCVKICDFLPCLIKCKRLK